MSTREFTKVVVRELPPMLQEADCKAVFDKEFAERYNWFSFSKGKHGQVPQRARCSAGSCNIKSSSACHVRNTRCSTRRYFNCDRLKTTRNSTAYLNFRSAADVIAFKSRFDGQTFAGNRGAHQICFVEYAPFQRTPKGRVKRDPREGTIEKGQEALLCPGARCMLARFRVYADVAACCPADAAYKAFVEELEQQPAPLPTAEQLLDQKQEAGEADRQAI